MRRDVRNQVREVCVMNMQDMITQVSDVLVSILVKVVEKPEMNCEVLKKLTWKQIRNRKVNKKRNLMRKSSKKEILCCISMFC